MNRGIRGIVTGLFLISALLTARVAFGEEIPGSGEGTVPGKYQEILLEKVGEVSEIRYKELIESNSEESNNEDALMRLALYRYFQDDFSGSEYYLRRLIGRYGETESGREAKIWLGRTYLARGEYRAALVELQSGLEEMEDAGIASDDLIGQYLFWIGEGYRQNGKAADARHYFESFLKRVPEHPLSSLLIDRLRETYRTLGLDPSSLWVVRSRDDRAPAETGSGGGRVKSNAGSFRVRVGSFTVRENAVELVRDLKEKGFDADIENADLETGTFYRVVLEWKADRREVEKIADKIRREGYTTAYVEKE